MTKTTSFCVFLVLILFLSYSSSDSEGENMPVEQWKTFKAEHGKNYPDEEDAKRFEIFKENLAMIKAHNEKYDKGEVSYKMGLNKFSDWFPEERDKLHGAKPLPK